MILSTFIYVWKSSIIKKIKKLMDSGVKESGAHSNPTANNPTTFLLCYLGPVI